MKLKFLLFACFFTAFSFIANAAPPGTGEENAKKNDVMGGVIHFETKKPISNVSVTAYANSKKEKVVLTDVNGNYSFTDLKPGTYRFVFEKDGYKKTTKEKYIVRADEAQQLNIQLEEHASFDFMPGPSQFFDF
jgi:uncharacterized GH25 family protein